MIKLDAQFQTVVRNFSSFNGSVSDVAVVTDKLFVSDVSVDFTTGVLKATLRKGTNDPFMENLDPVVITVNPNGSFSSSDGAWNGAVPQLAGLVAALAAQFDQFILASGAVTGTVE